MHMQLRKIDNRVGTLSNCYLANVLLESQVHHSIGLIQAEIAIAGSVAGVVSGR
jgi:hypothetical protein